MVNVHVMQEEVLVNKRKDKVSQLSYCCSNLQSGPRPGFEPGTSSTQRRNHTTRPSGLTGVFAELMDTPQNDGVNTLYNSFLSNTKRMFLLSIFGIISFTKYFKCLKRFLSILDITFNTFSNLFSAKPVHEIVMYSRSENTFEKRQ
jgi:hypothetical protein